MASGEDLQTHGDFAGPHHSQLTRRAMGQVDHPVISKRSSVIDPHYHAVVVVEVGDANPGPEGQGLVRCGEGAFA